MYTTDHIFWGYRIRFVELESERLIYRKFKPEDLPIYSDLRGDLENNKYWISEPISEAETWN